MQMPLYLVVGRESRGVSLEAFKGHLRVGRACFLTIATSPTMTFPATVDFRASAEILTAAITSFGLAAKPFGSSTDFSATCDVMGK